MPSSVGERRPRANDRLTRLECSSGGHDISRCARITRCGREPADARAFKSVSRASSALGEDDDRRQSSARSHCYLLRTDDDADDDDDNDDDENYERRKDERRLENCASTFGRHS